MNNRAKSLVATSLAHFVNDGSLYVFISLYPKLFPLQTEYVLIGTLAAVQNLFSVIASPFVGRFADSTRKYGYLISFGLALIGVGILGFSVSVYFASGFSLFLFLIPFSVIAGLGSAFYHPLGGTVLNETWSSATIGRATGINGSMGSLGRAIFPLFVFFLAVYFTIPSVVTLSILCGAVALVVFRMLRGMDFGSPKSDAAKKKSTISLARILPLILPLTIVSFLKGFFSLGIVNFIPVYLEHIIGIKYGLELGFTFSLILALPIAGQLFFGTFADKFGRRFALGVSIGGSGLALLASLAVSNLYLQIAFLGIFGFFVFTGFPLLIPLAANAVPKEASTFSNSIVWGVGNVGGGAVGPLVIGILAQSPAVGSLGGAFLIAAVVSLLSIGFLPFVRASKA